MKKNVILHTLALMLLSSVLTIQVQAQEISKQIKNIPHQLEVLNDPSQYKIDGDQVEITSKGRTNLFNSPSGKSNVQNASMILFEPEQDFTFSAKVTGELKSVYDVAALVIYQDSETWAKLCYENSVKKEPTIVSVVTRKYSDDCNSETTGSHAWLSIIKKENEFSFFYSKDGDNWKMIRNFNLDVSGKIRIGFASHGSRGDGFTAKFSEIKYQDKALEDMRDL